MKMSYVATMAAQIAYLVIQKRSDAQTGAAGVCMLALKKLVPDKSLIKIGIILRAAVCGYCFYR